VAKTLNVHRFWGGSWYLKKVLRFSFSPGNQTCDRDFWFDSCLTESVFFLGPKFEMNPFKLETNEGQNNFELQKSDSIFGAKHCLIAGGYPVCRRLAVGFFQRNGVFEFGTSSACFHWPRQEVIGLRSFNLWEF